VREFGCDLSGEDGMRGLAIAFILTCGCSAHNESLQRFSSLQIEAKTLCEVMADPSRYAGRRVIMKGIYVQEPHQRVLYDPNCQEWDFRVSESTTADGAAAAKRIVRKAAKKDPTVSIPVVYDGTFTVSHFLLDCSERNCFRYSLTDARLLAASPR
jgi:hypothetical protein